MKKKILLLFFLVLILSGCGRIEVEPQEGSVESGEKNVALVNIVDTTAPEIKVKRNPFIEGTRITANDLVDVSDASDTELFLYSVDSEIPMEAAYVFLDDVFLVKAVDKYGNATTEKIIPELITINKEKNVENPVNIENYLHKVWVLDQEAELGYASTFTFVIDSIDDNKIKGKILVYEDDEMDLESNRRRTEVEYGSWGHEFVGTVEKKYAKCKFLDAENQEGILYIWFSDNENVEAAVLRDIAGVKKDVMGRAPFSPYNITDLEEYSYIYNSFKVNIDFYGDVYIICGENNYVPKGHIIPLAYLADENGNIFYRFEGSFYEEIIDVYIADFNGDGKTDIKLSENCKDEELGVVEDVYIQAEGGFFDWYRKYEKEELCLD